jgi:hypothetical protein
MVFDRAGEEDDALAQEAGIDVVRALAARGVFDDLRDEILIIDLYGIAHPPSSILPRGPCKAALIFIKRLF